MLAKRSSMEIIHEILQMDGKKKTSIMYATALTHPQLQRYLSALIERGLVIKASAAAGGEIYHVTPRGKDLSMHLAAVLDYLGLGEYEAVS